MSKKNSICIIGAREGSKRIPGKNKLKLKNIPLFLNALQVAEKSDLFKKIIFTTDDSEILNSLRAYSNIIVDTRPANLSSAVSSMWEVTDYLIKKYSVIFNDVKDFCIITPCHPFRKSHHIVQAYDIFQKSNADYLMSVSESPCPSELTLEIEEDLLKVPFNGLVRKGDYKKKYYPNGAISFLKLSFFIGRKGLYSGKTVPYIMDWVDSLDIDYPKDYELALKLQRILN